MTDLAPDVQWMGPGDAEAYGRMAHALWPGTSEADLIADNAAALSGTSQRRRSAIAMVSGIAEAGFADIALRDYVDGADASPCAHLEGIWVAPEARGLGVAHALIRFFEQWVRDQGLSEMTSDARVENVISHAAHARWGFTEHARIVQFHKRLV